MKKKTLRVVCITCLIVLLGATSTCFGTIDADYSTYILARGESDIINVDFSGESSYDYYYSDDLVASYVDDMNQHKAVITVEANKDAGIGWHLLNIIGDTSDDAQFVCVYVYDDSAPELKQVRRINNGAVISWYKTESLRYQVQYRVKGGTWKTAEAFTNSSSCTIKGLNKGKTYYFRVRGVFHTYEYDNAYGYWSETYSKRI